MPASCRAFLLSLHTPFETLKLFTSVERTNSAEADSSVNFRFEGDLLQALEELEGLSLFPVVQFKAKQRFIIEKIVERRDVLGQLIEESNLPNVAYKLEGLKIVRC